MATFEELTRRYARYEASALGHLKRLVGSWSLLADLCFSDLFLFVPVSDQEGSQFVVIGQIRPSTGQTLYREDMVGQVLDEIDWPLVARSWRLEQIIEGELPGSTGERMRLQCIPVRWKGVVLGVLLRVSTALVGRRSGELEQKYIEAFKRFACMVAEGEFPFATEESLTEEAPRVGDGVLVLDRTAHVEYSSPNAVSALHRLGILDRTDGRLLDEVGFKGSTIRSAFAYCVPVSEEVEGPGGATVLVRCIPLVHEGQIGGAVVLMRDVSDLRRRDRLLLSKDATIREIHHRVKNNLQTVSSLLRVQARRLDSLEARAALEESVRRIRSIALVHETLSRSPGEQVPFDDILRPLVRMVAESMTSDERPVRFEVQGKAGQVGDRVATQLAVVLTELLQNAVEHAFPEDPVEAGQVTVSLQNDGRELVMSVHDNGVGLPPDFSIDTTESVGLSIVRALVTIDLAGTITMKANGGTVVELHVPVTSSGGPTVPVALSS